MSRYGYLKVLQRVPFASILGVDCTCLICMVESVNVFGDIGDNRGLTLSITKTFLYNFDPLKPHFYIVKLWFTGVDIIFHISA